MTLEAALSGIIAALLAYLFNRLARGPLGRISIVVLAPGLEETFKTGTALGLGAPVLATHVAFGLVEAGYDLVVTGRNQTHPSRRVAAAAVGLGGHALFGATTLAGYVLTGLWPVGVVAAYLLHMTWNSLVIGKVGRRR